MAKTIKVGDVSVEAGERRAFELPITDLYTNAQTSMPVEIVNGKKPGPTLFVSAALHGDEINGVEIVRRLLAHGSLKRLRGALIAVPIVNVLGFMNLSRYLPDRRDLNRSFPGSQGGSAASRLAHIFVSEILLQSDCGIDLHTAAVHRSNLPQIRATFDNHEVRRLAAAFGAPVIVNAPNREGSLRAFAADNNIPMLVYEAGEALRFDEISIRSGVRGVLRVMRAMGMLPVRTPPKVVEPVVATDSAWIRAPQSGIVIALPELGRRVRRGDTVATISDPVGANQHAVISPHPGIVIGRTELPLVYEGDALCHIAEFEKPKMAEETVAAFKEHHEA
ncbi:MAG: succinylglutamate desuccinylase/aspartoacylase family protein [Pseudomonadota bacterium]